MNSPLIIFWSNLLFLFNLIIKFLINYFWMWHLYLVLIVRNNIEINNKLFLKRKTSYNKMLQNKIVGLNYNIRTEQIKF